MTPGGESPRKIDYDPMMRAPNRPRSPTKPVVRLQFGTNSLPSSYQSKTIQAVSTVLDLGPILSYFAVIPFRTQDSLSPEMTILFT